MTKSLLLVFFLVQSTLTSHQDWLFNDALITEPSTATGPSLTATELRLASIRPPAVPHPSQPRPPLDRPPLFRNYVSFTFARWPNNRVPYTLDASFQPDQRVAIAQAFQHVEEHSCVRFQPKTNADRDFVHIYTDEKESCWADDHYERKKGQHNVHLHKDYCVFKHVIAHELLHLLGVGHEHQRPDRDRYLAVNWSNINVDHAFNFFKDRWDTELHLQVSYCHNWREQSSSKSSDFHFENCSSGLIRKDYGIGYDYHSIMHYEENFFAIDPSYATVTALDPSAGRLGGPKMTEKDKEKLQAAYNCVGTEYTGCGGSVTGDQGILRGTFDRGCEWLITVDDGDTVEIEFLDFEVGNCRNANVTIYAGIKEVQDVKGFYCGVRQPNRIVTVWSSSVTIEFKKERGTKHSFIAKWRKASVACCMSVRMSIGPSLVWRLFRPYLGIYRAVGRVNSQVYYRLAGNPNVWLARTQPLSSFGLAAWAVGHDLEGPPGHSRRPKFFLGGNVKCAHLISTLYYRTGHSGPFLNDNSVRVECI